LREKRVGNKILEPVSSADEKIVNEWVPRRDIPREDAWFEKSWEAFRREEIYG
jgi:hypothetical protein